MHICINQFTGENILVKSSVIILILKINIIIWICLCNACNYTSLSMSKTVNNAVYCGCISWCASV